VLPFFGIIAKEAQKKMCFLSLVSLQDGNRKSFDFSLKKVGVVFVKLGVVFA